MDRQNVLALHFKFASLSKEKRASLTSFLPETLQSALKESSVSQHILPISLTIEKLARRIHISHFIDFLALVSPSEKSFYIAAFPEYKQLQFSKEATIFRHLTSKKFSDAVLHTLFEKALIGFPPPTYYPFHPLIEILGDTGVALETLIHYLGLFDIAIEVKTLLSKKTLKELQQAFSPQEVTFLNTLSATSAKSIFPIYLERYNGDKDQLKEFILERGIYRFVQGIYSMPSQYHFLITYFVPKKISDQVNQLLKQKHLFSIDYYNWEEDILTTWRFLCTYSQSMNR
jgi:hypothetical protein